MGTREVARRVAGSGRAFLKHCGVFPALKLKDLVEKSSIYFAFVVCIDYFNGVLYLLSS